MKANRGKLLVAVMAMVMVFAAVAIITSDDGVDAASKDTTYISGEVTSTQNYGDGTNVVVNGNLTIPEGMSLIVSGTGKFTINEGATVTIKAGGQLIFQQTTVEGKTNTPTVVIDGDIVAEGNVAGKTAIINNAPAYDSEKKTGIQLNGSILLEKGAELKSGDVTLDDGTSYTKIEGGITVEDGGSINVTKKSSNVSGISEQTIMMKVGATLKINGKVDAVTIKAAGSGKYYTAGAVQLDAFDGQEQDYKVDPKAASDLTFTVTTETISALQEQKVDSSKITLKQFILNVDGTLANGDKLTTTAGDSVNDGVNDSMFFQADGMKTYQFVPKVSVTGSLTVENESSLYIKTYTHVDVSGSLTIKYDDKESNTAPFNAVSNINGSLHVTGSVSFYYFEDQQGSSNVKFNNDAGKNSCGDYNSDIGNRYYNTLWALNKIIVDGGTMAVTTDDYGSVLDVLAGNHVYGSAYYAEGTGNEYDTVYVTDFATAVANATDIESPEIHVYAWGAQNRDNAKDAVYNGAAVVDKDLTIPDGMTLYIYNALVVADGSTLTLDEGAAVEIAYGKEHSGSDTKNNATNAACLWVVGKVVDYYGAMEDYEDAYYTFKNPVTSGTGEDRALFIYEVKKTTETDTDTIATYTTLKIALSEAVSGEKIQLNGEVEIIENLTIPEGVTVIADDVTGDAIDVKGVTLTVDGTLDMAGGSFAVSKDDDEVDGKIVVNNIIKNVASSNTSDRIIAGAYFSGKIGDDRDGTSYITSVSVAAANSTTTESIVLFGNVSMNDVTFTAGEDGLAVVIVNDGDKNVATAGTVTLVGEVTFQVKEGRFTGSVASDVTGGLASVRFDKIEDLSIGVDMDDNGETKTSKLEMSVYTGKKWIDGSATVESGTLYISGTTGIDMITVASGSTLVIPENADLEVAHNPTFDSKTIVKKLPLITEGLVSSMAGLVIDGTVTVQKGGDLYAEIAYVSGDLNIEKEAGEVEFVVSYVDGTITVAEKETVNYGVMLLDGKIAGNVDNIKESSAMLVAFPGSDVSAAKINFGTSDKSAAKETTYYVNGDEYAKVYATENIAVNAIILVMDIPGYVSDSAVFYSDAGANQELCKVPADVLADFSNTSIDEAGGFYAYLEGLGSVFDGVTDIGVYSDVYVTMDPAEKEGTISAGTGLDLYIDNVKWDATKKTLTVGEHTVSFDVKAGYDGSKAVITFNGQTVTDGKIVITGDMKDFTLVATGATPVDYSQGGSSGSSDMGIVEYLLIVLVVVVVILAIFVVLRMMRS